MSASRAEDPRPGDWVVWDQTRLSLRIGRVTRVHLGRGTRRMVVKRWGGLKRELFCVDPRTSDRDRTHVPAQSVTTVIRTGEDGEGGRILELLQHDRPDIRTMALRAIAEHTGDRWQSPWDINVDGTQRHATLGGWLPSDEDA